MRVEHGLYLAAASTVAGSFGLVSPCSPGRSFVTKASW